MEFLLQPQVYKTGHHDNLLSLLSDMWINNDNVENGTLYIISGFANYNGGVRFFPFFSKHIHEGGKVKVIVGGSTAQRLSSQQVVESLLQCGAQVYVVNRKRLVHAKCYGYDNHNAEEIVVSSGNFTGPGMSQNAEAAVRIDPDSVRSMHFSWSDLFNNIMNQKWDIYEMNPSDITTKADPGWKLLYDEVGTPSELSDDQEVTMVVTLSHSDTARIQAEKGSKAGLGTQYFWLSKGTFDFFPALTEKNKRGIKNTYSCTINMDYVDIGKMEQSKVTFEADNNLDFRLGTGTLRYTKIANKDDIALITRLSEYDYQLKKKKKNNHLYQTFRRYAVNYIGNQGKMYGFMDNSIVYGLLGIGEKKYNQYSLSANSYSMVAEQPEKYKEK